MAKSMMTKSPRENISIILGISFTRMRTSLLSAGNDEIVRRGLRMRTILITETLDFSIYLVIQLKKTTMKSIMFQASRR